MYRSAAAALALGGSLVLGLTLAPAAHADSATCTNTGFGVASQYGEFILGDDDHSPDAEGAVAVGGNADFSHGFSLGNELTQAEVEALPGHAALVVRGDIHTDGTGTHVMKGNAVIGGAINGKIDLHGGTLSHAADLIDFDGEFAALRKLSTALGAESTTAGATVVSSGSRITLTGTDTVRNVFTVGASVLEQAKEVYIQVPAGSTTVINVTGTSYDMAKAGTTGFFLAGSDGKFVLDDKSQSAAGGAIRAKLLWNFAEATSVVKNSASAWPGTVLAPNAHFELGTGGPVNGSVLAASLHGSGGAETHHYPFSGCLPDDVPTTTPPTTPTTPATDTPTDTPTGTPTDTPTDTPTSPVPTATGTSDVPGGTPTPSGATTSPASGGLASTGSSGTVPIAVGAGVALVVGAGLAVAARRRRANPRG